MNNGSEVNSFAILASTLKLALASNISTMYMYVCRDDKERNMLPKIERFLILGNIHCVFLSLSSDSRY